jgi:hypothetical protein
MNPNPNLLFILLGHCDDQTGELKALLEGDVLDLGGGGGRGGREGGRVWGKEGGGEGNTTDVVEEDLDRQGKGDEADEE